MSPDHVPQIGGLGSPSKEAEAAHTETVDQGDQIVYKIKQDLVELVQKLVTLPDKALAGEGVQLRVFGHQVRAVR